MNEAPSDREVHGAGCALVVDARRRALADVDPTARLLGLSMPVRLALAAAKAGFDPIRIVADPGDVAALQFQLPADGAIAVSTDLPKAAGDVPLAVMPATLVGEVAWLGALRQEEAESGAVRSGPDGIRLLAPTVAVDAMDSGPRIDLTPRPMAISGAAGRPAAEARLLKALVKQTDGFMARHVARPISLAVSRRLTATGVTPNQMTIVSALIGICGAPFFLSADPAVEVIGGLLFVLHSVLDGCDGELARLKFQESRFGGLLDFAGDNLVHVAVFACMAIGWSLAVDAAWPLYLGIAAVAGTAGSAFAVYWLTLREGSGGGPVYTSVTGGEKTGLTRIMDDLSRRDFIYVVLALAAFGKADWFLIPTSIGAPVFCGLIVVVWLRSGRAGPSRPGTS